MKIHPDAEKSPHIDKFFPEEEKPGETPINHAGAQKIR